MRAIVERGNLANRTWKVPLATSIATFAAIVALALAGGGASPTAFGAATVAVWLAVIATLIARREQPAFAPELVWVAALLAALLGITALSLGWGSDAGAGFLDVARLAGYLGVVVLAGLHLRPGSGLGILKAIALAVVAIAIVALGARLAGFGSGDSGLTEFLPLAAGRLSYPLGYWNALGALMALAVPALLHLAAKAEDRRGLWLIAGAPVLLTAYMTQSRGAILAVLIGVAVVIATAPARRRTAAALAIMVGAALPACIAASLAPGIRDSAGEGAPGGSEILVAGLLLAGVLAALRLGPPLLERFGPERRRLALRPRIVLPVLAVLLAVIVLLGGPGKLADDFSSLPADPRTAAASGILSASGSGRAQFWDAALEAFADEPVRGIGAGGFATYWNRVGSLGTPVRDVHSAPLELLAELGLLGACSFLAIFAIAFVSGSRRAREPGGDAAGAAIGVLAAGSVGLLIDFTWQVPAVAVPLLVLIVALAGPGFAAASEPATSRRPHIAVPAPALALALVAVALVSIWAGGVVAIADARLAESREALAAGDASGAASSARAAIAVEPWAAEPWLQLADIEQTVDNLPAARRAALEAIERSPDDFRSWLLLSNIDFANGDIEAAGNYATRSVRLAPLVLQRLDEFVPSGP